MKQATICLTTPAVTLFFSILALTADVSNLHAEGNRLSGETVHQRCMWPTDPGPPLDSTYRWHGLYLGGIERTVTVIVRSNDLTVHEKNAKAIDGLLYHFTLTGGQLDTSRKDEGTLAIHGTKLEGEITRENTITRVGNGSWRFETTDCGKTYRLIWSLSGHTISGEYVFGPTGYEWAHGANMASAAIYRN